MSEFVRTEDDQVVKTDRVVVVPSDSEGPIDIPRIAVKDSRADVTLARAEVAHEKSRDDAELDRVRDEEDKNARPIDIPRLPVPRQVVVSNTEVEVVPNRSVEVVEVEPVI